MYFKKKNLHNQKKDIYVGFKPKKQVSGEQCHCFYQPEIADMACGTNCMNR